jgi:hypothetical protein
MNGRNLINLGNQAEIARWPLVLLVLFIGVLTASSGEALTLNVVDQNGAAVSGFEWLVEEDNTSLVTPGAMVSNSLSMSIHKSYAPPVAAGHALGNAAVVNIPTDTRYVVSVLPDSGHTMSGANVAIGQSSVTVIVNSLPVPTAQISIFVFEDNNPVNNSPDLPGEQGLEGFTVQLSDMGGTIMMDAFGNPLDSTYATDINGNIIFNPDGSPQMLAMGDGVITTDVNGEATVKYIPPGKYGIVMVPPASTNWMQTTTIEGSPTIDAWVKGGESKLIVEFGPAFTHIFMGFVDPDQLPWALTPPAGSGTITGQVVNNHQSAPPAVQGFPGHPIDGCWVALNDLTTKEGLVAQACEADGNFTFSNVPPGSYQLVVWDTYMDRIIGFQTVSMPSPAGTVNLGQVLSFAWFGTLENYVFNDVDEDGFRDPTEEGIPEQNVNIRWRDGTIYQAFPTDLDGYVPFDEVFPFFHWLVAEVDYARLKATGATFIVDDGGAVPADNGWTMPSGDRLTPQPQLCTQSDIDAGNCTTLGDPINNPNTGNNLSRTETGEVLTQSMFLFAGQTNYIDWGKKAYTPGSGENGGISGLVLYATTRAENDPQYAAAEPWEPGIPRVQVNLYEDFNNDKIIDDQGADGVDLADVDNHPLGWASGGAMGVEDIDWNSNGVFDMGDAVDVTWTDSWDDSMPTGCQHDSLPVIHGQTVGECYDNFGTWNQLRPGVFDGGYAFGPDLPAGYYIVEAATPTGYEILKEEDRNVDFGEEYTPYMAVLPPICVGDPHLVPTELSLFAGEPAPYAGETRPLCDRKRIGVSEGKNAAVDFFLFTYVPKAGRGAGFVNNDLAAEGDINNPNFGEKAAPSWIPISFRDYAGNEITRVYLDEFGAYNALLPSTFTMNIAAPSGVSPNMIQICLNHPGPIPDAGNPGQFITDPQYDPQFSFTCYTFNFQPGMTTYLDTPVISVAAFVHLPPGVNIDRNLPDGTPVLNTVNGPGSGGPLVSGAGDVVTITSLGTVQVPDPLGAGTIARDFGFGSVKGTVTIGGVAVPDGDVTWAADGGSISFTTPAGASTGQLIITRGDNGKTTITGITLHVGTGGGNVWYVNPGDSIQATIGAAASGDLIIIKPGTYDENVILWKNVYLQGTGAPSTVINALPVPGDRLTIWRSTVQNLIDSSLVDLVAGQPTVDTFLDAEAPGIMVMAKNGEFGASPGLIDGLTVFGTVTGGGIVLNGFIDNMSIGNSRIMSNLGTYGGGIRVGLAGLDSSNDNVNIHHNLISQNGGINGGGGVTLFNGSSGYTISDNFIHNNFARLNGGGILHIGLNDGGSIKNNTIAFNEVFYGGELGGDGGGIYVAGEDPPGGGVSDGAGSVMIDANLLQGNLAGAGDGGGMAAIQVNGLDVQNNPSTPSAWYELNFTNNIVVNNVAAFRGGGVYLQDVARGNVQNNTIANNDSTATSADALAGGAVMSTPQGAGLVASVHSATLQTDSGQTFSDPVLEDNIFWHNGSYYRDASLNGGIGGLVWNDYWDLDVSGDTGLLNPEYCILTDTTGYGVTNLSSDPLFVLEYTNTIHSAAAGDEGGNFVNVIHTPLILESGDYHITFVSPAKNAGTDTGLAYDYDGDMRPSGSVYDIGADEFFTGPAAFGGGDIGVFRTGWWYLDSDGVLGWDFATDTTLAFGLSTDTPVTGDWDGSGNTDVGVFRDGWWYLESNGTPGLQAGDTTRAFGLSTDVPVTGDWNGDNTTDIGVFRDGWWYLDSDGTPGWNSATDTTLGFGMPSDVPVTGDWNSDGKTDIGIFRNGWWYLDSNGTPGWQGGTDAALMFGMPTDEPVTGDWDSNGDTNIGVFRDGWWYLDSNGTLGWQGGADTSVRFGLSADNPVTGAW